MDVIRPAEAEAQKKLDSITATKEELANFVGYTYRQCYNIDRSLPDDNKLFEKAENGEYKLSTFVKNWVFYNVEKQRKGLNLELTKARHEIVKMEKTSLEVQKMRGSVVDVNDVKKLWGDIANTVTQNMMHLPSKIAPMILMMDNVEIVSSMIADEIRKVLEAIAETPLPDYAEVEMDEESEEEVDEEGEV